VKVIQKKTLNKSEVIFVKKNSPFSYTVIIFLLVGGHEKKKLYTTYTFSHITVITWIRKVKSYSEEE